MQVRLVRFLLLINFGFIWSAAAPKEGAQTRSYAGKIYEPKIGQAKVIYPEKREIAELPPELKNIILEYVGDFQVVGKIKTTSRIGSALGIHDVFESLLFLPNNKIASLVSAENAFFSLRLCDFNKQKCNQVNTMARTLNKIIKLDNNRIVYFYEHSPMGGLLREIVIYNYNTKKYDHIPVDIYVEAIAHLPGDKIAIAGEQELRIYDVATKYVVKSFGILPGPVGLEVTYIRDLIALDKDHVVLAVRDKLIVYNVNYGSIVKQFESYDTQSLLRLSDTRFISRSGMVFRIWDLNLDESISEWFTGVVTVAALYDENTVITSSGNDLKFWDIRSGKEINKIISQDMIYSLAVSDNGDIAAGGADQIVLFRNLAKIFRDERKTKRK